jgi:hypothetical protein
VVSFFLQFFLQDGRVIGFRHGPGFSFFWRKARLLDYDKIIHNAGAEHVGVERITILST